VHVPHGGGFTIHNNTACKEGGGLYLDDGVQGLEHASQAVWQAAVVGNVAAAARDVRRQGTCEMGSKMSLLKACIPCQNGTYA
jgi:hypothetical protein